MTTYRRFVHRDIVLDQVAHYTHPTLNRPPLVFLRRVASAVFDDREAVPHGVVVGKWSWVRNLHTIMSTAPIATPKVAPRRAQRFNQEVGADTFYIYLGGGNGAWQWKVTHFVDAFLHDASMHAQHGDHLRHDDRCLPPGLAPGARAA